MKNWQKRKTFFILLIITEIQSNNDIALGIVSSDIVSIVLDGGRKAHSAF